MHMQTASVQLYSAAGTLVVWVGHTHCTRLTHMTLLTYYLCHPAGMRLHVVQHSYLICSLRFPYDSPAANVQIKIL